MTLKGVMHVTSLEISAAARCCGKGGTPPQGQCPADLDDGLSVGFGLDAKCSFSPKAWASLGGPAWPFLTVASPTLSPVTWRLSTPASALPKWH